MRNKKGIMLHVTEVCKKNLQKYNMSGVSISSCKEMVEIRSNVDNCQLLFNSSHSALSLTSLRLMVIFVQILSLGILL